MKKQIFSIILLFFLVFSNVSVVFTTFSYFIFEKDFFSFSKIASIQEQCSLLVNVPKEFVDICIKVSCDVKSFTVLQDKKLYILDNVYEFVQIPCILACSIKNLKVIKCVYEYNNLLVNYIKICAKMFYIPIVIFYLLCYIGLLCLFESMGLLRINSIIKSVYCYI